MMKKYLISVFWALVGVFFVIVSEFYVPAVKEFFMGSILFLLPFLVFFLLGIVLIFFTLKEKVTGKLKKFLILTGASAAGFFIFIFLHNIFYGLGVITSHITVLSYLTEILHAVFFIIAIFICPLGFLVGVGGSISLFIRRKTDSNIVV